MDNSVLSYTFYNDVAKPQKYVLYGDTDSLYLNFPTIKPNNTEEAIVIANDIAEKINKLIENVMNNLMLPKMGISPEYNRTEFKTEVVANGMILLDVKKTYAYRVLAKEGKIIDPPEVEYKNISVKSDISKWTKELLRGIIGDIVLNPEIAQNEVHQHINNFAIEMKQKLDNCLENFDFDYIGTPKKWGSSYKKDIPSHVIAMKLFNTIMNEKILTPMSGAYIIPIQIKNPVDFESKISPIKNDHETYLGNTPISKINYIGFPYSYNKEKAKRSMEYYGISIDHDKLWNSLFHKHATEIIQLNQAKTRQKQMSTVQG